MNDAAIVTLYWERSERAIEETAAKYGRYCHSIAYNILYNEEDAKECVNDTYMSAWNSMPPHRPEILSTFLGKITRRISLKKWRYKNAEKRGGGEVPLALEELMECIPAGGHIGERIEAEELSKAISEFLLKLKDTERRVFVLRYWYLKSVVDISKQFGFSESKVKSILYRVRLRLLEYLKKEGMFDE